MAAPVFGLAPGRALHDLARLSCYWMTLRSRLPWRFRNSRFDMGFLGRAVASLRVGFSGLIGWRNQIGIACQNPSWNHDFGLVSLAEMGRAMEISVVLRGTNGCVEIPQPLDRDFGFVDDILAAAGVLPEFGEITQPGLAFPDMTQVIHSCRDILNQGWAPGLAQFEHDFPDHGMTWDDEVLLGELEGSRGMVCGTPVSHEDRQYILAGIPKLDSDRPELVRELFVDFSLHCRMHEWRANELDCVHWDLVGMGGRHVITHTADFILIVQLALLSHANS